MRWLWTLPVASVVVGGSALAIGLGGGEDPLHVWEVKISGDPRVLVVTYVGPSLPCGASTRVAVEEGESTVALRAWAGEGQDGVCPAMGQVLTAEVELEEALGDREVIDGHDGQAVVVQGSSDRG